MSAAVRKLEPHMDGVEIRKLESFLDNISDQLRLMDQKIIMKTEQEISNRYENQRYELSKLRNDLEKIK